MYPHVLILSHFFVSRRGGTKQAASPTLPSPQRKQMSLQQRWSRWHMETISRQGMFGQFGVSWERSYEAIDFWETPVGNSKKELGWHVIPRLFSGGMIEELRVFFLALYDIWVTGGTSGTFGILGKVGTYFRVVGVRFMVGHYLDRWRKPTPVSGSQPGVGRASQLSGASC